MAMTRAYLDGIMRMHDVDGVISVYVCVDPTDSSARPGWRIRLDAGLSALVDGMRDRARAAVLAQGLDQLHGPLERLLDPASPGRGRALFGQLRSGQVHTVAVQDEWTDRVDLAPVPHVMPLLRAWTLGAPAGAAIVSAHRVHLVDTRFGVTRELEVLAVPDEPMADRRELVGPGADAPGRFQQSSTQTDLFTQREADHITAFLRQAGPRIAATAIQAGWEDLLVAGEPKLASAVIDGLPAEHPVAVTLVPKQLEHQPSHHVTRTIAHELATTRRERAARLAEQARDLALAGGPAAYGLADVLTALNEDRVAHLVIDADHHWHGRRAPDGRMVPQGDSLAGVADENLVDEPLLADHMAISGFRAGAQVTVLDGLTAIQPGDGVTALLRW